MVFYFSATGNTKWIAETVAAALGDQTADIRKTAPKRLEKIIDRLKKREDHVIDAYEGPDPDAYDTLADQFYANAVTEPFYVDNNLCVGCELCARNCPASAIEMQNNRPVWIKDHCYYCSGCINNCPKEAIGFGDQSQGVYRYTWKKYNS